MEIFNIFNNLMIFILHITNTDSFPSPLSQKKENELVNKMVDGDIEAKNELIEHNLRLVAHIIKKYYSNYSDQDDLISIGTIGLIKGINSYNPEKGTKLATYAARCIENEILMYFRSLKKTSQEISFSEPIDTDNEGNPLTLMDIICIDDTIIDDIDKKNKIKTVLDVINNLDSQRDKLIIIKRYGLDGNKPQTQREVASSLGISRSYISRIEKRIINEIKIKFKSVNRP